MFEDLLMTELLRGWEFCAFLGFFNILVPVSFVVAEGLGLGFYCSGGALPCSPVISAKCPGLLKKQKERNESHL